MNRPTPQTPPATPADLARVTTMIDRKIGAFIKIKALPIELRHAIEYAVLGGGKRLRPALAWYSSIAVGGNGEDALDAGTAVELIHAFSLVHDDLPALDDDDLRRGKPTLHIHTNEPMAILAGDAMLSLAYEAVLEHHNDQISHRLSRELARGTRAMIIGQVYDTLGGLPDDLSPQEQLKLIHSNKTGALLCAACRMGAICGGASDEQLELVTQYAQAIGLQFQIVDDLLDIEGAADEVGKALGKDIEAGKMTYPGILGQDRSREIVDELAKQASAALDGIALSTNGTVEPLRTLGQVLTSRTR